MRFEYRNLDWKLIFATLILSLIGIVMIYSATYDPATGVSQNNYIKQIVWLILALALFFLVVRIPLRTLDLAAYPFYAASIVLLLMVLLVGATRKGASRWFDLGPLSLAPSDIAKLALLIAISRYLAVTKLPPESKRRLALSALLAGLPIMLIIKQPDLGTALVFVALLASLWFWAGLSPYYLALVFSPFISLIAAFHWLTWVIYLAILVGFILLLRPGLLFGFAIMTVNLGFGMITPFIWNHLADYQKLRVLTFLDPGRDPKKAGYQIIQSKIAIGSGGLLGKGYLEGSQSQLKFLPERHTDFIYSVLGEEFGFWGSAIVILLFGFIFYRGIRIAARCRSKFASNLAWGALTILFFQFYVNIGMTFGLMPVTGLPLPFISYGGTSLALSWTLIGIIALADYNRTEY
jgi:rod shape determining protein RodA